MFVVPCVCQTALCVKEQQIDSAYVAEFHVSNTWLWVRLEGLPIFFGTTSSAFEGAGAVGQVTGGCGITITTIDVVLSSG